MEIINERVRLVYKSYNITLKSFSEALDISEGTLKSMFNRGTNPSFEVIEKLANAYPDISMDWLITGKGDMYKTEYNAGRDNNVNTGDNKGVIGNTGTIGNMVAENSGNYVSMGDQKAKKIMESGKVTIEMEQSAEIELLQQTNASLAIRITDLEAMIVLKDKVYEDMKSSMNQIIEMQKQMIDLLNNRVNG